MQDSDSEGWGRAFRENLIWFAFAVLLSLGASYFTTQMNVQEVRGQVANAQETLDDVEEQSDINAARRRKLRIKVIRLESKIDALLRVEGVDPNQFRSPNNSDLSQ